MPSVDFFSLGNSSLSGPSSGKYKAVLLNIGAGKIVIVPAQTTNMNAENLVDFEAGTKLINIGVGNVAGGPWQMTSFNSSNVYMRFALFDSAGVPWFLHDIGALQTQYSVGSITIDLVSGVATTLQASGNYAFDGSAYTWRGIFFNKPTNFNVNGPLKLGVCGTNATQNNGNSQYTIINMRVASL
ncbi:hypothetical protein DC345_19815 [Paenibacillus taichungensis]|uniref:Uncharacterized protein n=1 Tax=Paenibacillus taichungensis TaxID=484184 RepID=A0A329QNZ1_9BACL|nr:hypothetical protein [Paenibacillus taichungensis]RAW13591.1 hypothetical protein DC345_19815 [Paenibacillus taichungensis]